MKYGLGNFRRSGLQKCASHHLTYSSRHDVERITPIQFILVRAPHSFYGKVNLRLRLTMTPGGSRSDQSDGFKYLRINDQHCPGPPQNP